MTRTPAPKPELQLRVGTSLYQTNASRQIRLVTDIVACPPPSVGRECRKALQKLHCSDLSGLFKRDIRDTQIEQPKCSSGQSSSGERKVLIPCDGLIFRYPRSLYVVRRRLRLISILEKSSVLSAAKCTAGMHAKRTEPHTKGIFQKGPFFRDFGDVPEILHKKLWVTDQLTGAPVDGFSKP